MKTYTSAVFLRYSLSINVRNSICGEIYRGQPSRSSGQYIFSLSYGVRYNEQMGERVPVLSHPVYISWPLSLLLCRFLVTLSSIIMRPSCCRLQRYSRVTPLPLSYPIPLFLHQSKRQHGPATGHPAQVLTCICLSSAGKFRMTL
jgi:hypothetical protein